MIVFFQFIIFHSCIYLYRAMLTSIHHCIRIFRVGKFKFWPIRHISTCCLIWKKYEYKKYWRDEKETSWIKDGGWLSNLISLKFFSHRHPWNWFWKWKTFFTKFSSRLLIKKSICFTIYSAPLIHFLFWRVHNSTWKWTLFVFSLYPWLLRSPHLLYCRLLNCLWNMHFNYSSAFIPSLVNFPPSLCTS